MAVAKDYRLTPALKLSLFHNLFSGDALRFYNRQIEGRCRQFSEAVNAIYKHFNSDDVQQRVKQELSSLSFNKFAEKHGSQGKALSSLATYIANRTPQCPIGFQSEANKVDFLKSAVKFQPWAKDILVRIKPDTQFQSLYTELANALQLHEEINPAGTALRPHGSSSRPAKPFVYFTQQRVVKKMAKAMFPGNENGPKCWNCGQKGHRMAKCPKPLDLTRIAAAKADFYAKKGNRDKAAKRVLYELVSGLDGLCEQCDEVTPSKEVETFFGDLLGKESDSSSETSASDTEQEEPKQELFTRVDDHSKMDGDNSDSDC